MPAHNEAPSVKQKPAGKDTSMQERLSVELIRAARQILEKRRDEAAISNSILRSIQSDVSRLQKKLTGAQGTGSAAAEENFQGTKSHLVPPAASQKLDIPKAGTTLKGNEQNSRRDNALGLHARQRLEAKGLDTNNILSGPVQTEQKNSNSARFVCLQQLSSEERKKARSFTKKHARDEEITKVNSVAIRGMQFSRLRPEQWLDDEIVNAFVYLLNSRNLRYRSSLKASAQEREAVMRSRLSRSISFTDLPRPHVHMFNSFFLEKLLQKPYNYENVRNWSRKAFDKASIFDCDLIMFPYNENKSHWVLATIDLRSKEFCYIDSYQSPEKQGVIARLRQWLKDEVRETGGQAMVDRLDIESWKGVVNPFKLKQSDGSSCGIFMLYTAYFLELGKTPAFSQKHVNTLRRRTALFFEKGELPDQG